MAILTISPESIGTNNPVCGQVVREVVDEIFSTIRSGAGTNFTLGNGNNTVSTGYLNSNATTNHYQRMRRGIFCFDTSSLGVNVIINSVTLSLWPVGYADQFGGGFTIGIVGATPASTSNLQNSDYGQLGTTRYATDISIASLSGGYNVWTFNATGISNINKTGITSLGVRLGADIDNTAPTWASNNISYMDVDCTTVGQVPKLTINYSIPSGNMLLVF